MDPFGIALILFVSALFSGGLAAYAWRRRGTPGTGIVFFLMLGTTIAVFAYGMELLSTTLADKMIWVRIRYTGTALIYPMYLLFALWHTNKQKWLAAGRVALLLVLPVFSVIGLFTNSLHHLHYTWVGLDTNGPFPMIVKTYGPLYGFYVITSFGYVLLALAILGSNYLLTPSFFRRQTAALMIGKANVYSHIGNGTSLGLFAGELNVMTKVGNGTTLAALFGKANIVTHVGGGLTGVLALGKANIINSMVEKGVTVMVTTHFMDEAEYCDRIGLVYRGKLIAHGTPDDLKNQAADDEVPDPTMEQAFISLIHQWDKEHEHVSH